MAQTQSTIGKVIDILKKISYISELSRLIYELLNVTQRKEELGKLLS